MVRSAMAAGEVQQVVGGYAKEETDGAEVLQAGFIFSALHIRDFSLGHMERRAQLGLVQLCLFPENPHFFPERVIHGITSDLVYHRRNLSIDI